MKAGKLICLIFFLLTCAILLLLRWNKEIIDIVAITHKHFVEIQWSLALTSHLHSYTCVSYRTLEFPLFCLQVTRLTPFF